MERRPSPGVLHVGVIANIQQYADQLFGTESSSEMNRSPLIFVTNACIGLPALIGQSTKQYFGFFCVASLGREVERCYPGNRSGRAALVGLALGFWYGSTLIGKGEFDMFQFFLCFMAIIFGAQSAATIFSFAPDIGKAHHAAKELKTLFNRKPTINT
ncbi:hypothetical protein ACHAQJ_009378 [Trichoderma viride]